MWTPTTRQQHSRPVTRYQTDLTDAEWRVIAPHLPKPSATGRPRAWPMREIVNGIFYVIRRWVSGPIYNRDWARLIATRRAL
jgi:putative transposase